MKETFPWYSLVLHIRDSAHDFIVKFSTSVCGAVVASLTGEMAAQSYMYHAHGTQ